MDSKIKAIHFFPFIFCIIVGIIWIYIRISSIYLFESHHDQKTIGVTYMTMNNAFYKIIDDEIKKQIQARGDKILTLDPALNEEKQNEQIQYMVNQQVDIIILNPVDWRKIRAGLLTAMEAGIPVIIIDSEVYDTSLVSSTIVSDNYEAGRLCAEEMMHDLDEGNILILDHMAAKSALDRVRGFEDAIRDHENYHVLQKIETQGQTERSYAKVKEALKYHKDVDVIMALNDPAALGALAAIERLKYYSNIYVYSVDASPDGKRLVNEGLLRGTVAQYPRRMARKAVEISYDLMNGKEVKKKNVLSVDMVNRDSLYRFSIERWQ